MFFRALALTKAVLGLLGIGLAVLQRRRSRLIFWLMVGSSIVLCLPLGHHFLVRLLSRLGLFGGYQALKSSYLPVAHLSSWTRWVAYALLFLGVLDLRFDKSEPALAHSPGPRFRPGPVPHLSRTQARMTGRGFPGCWRHSGFHPPIWQVFPIGIPSRMPTMSAMNDARQPVADGWQLRQVEVSSASLKSSPTLELPGLSTHDENWTQPISGRHPT
jgi:hypothetical protein